jgi:hypothetical protein
MLNDGFNDFRELRWHAPRHFCPKSRNIHKSVKNADERPTAYERPADTISREDLTSEGVVNSTVVWIRVYYKYYYTLHAGTFLGRGKQVHRCKEWISPVQLIIDLESVLGEQ